ncbi:hypothetical protein BT96DRAFT_942158 [Gymnopus androsaceus JB14]|uniref:Uncharacterized protein n=1 Tax=Gymnopus androsaceus JB14 TaxID=1447944 RepID=A0A6A4HFR0_9AGAR|nr:hypothetical protein BT96DRAFT_942158 [Gymnopus androsaceus JB14]
MPIPLLYQYLYMIPWVHEATYIHWKRLDLQLEDWQDPEDPDPERYTILAVSWKVLYKVSTWKLGLGICRDHRKGLMKRIEERKRDPEPLLKGPSWPSQVPPSPHKIVLNKMNYYFETQMEYHTHDYFKPFMNDGSTQQVDVDKEGVRLVALRLIGIIPDQGPMS